MSPTPEELDRELRRLLAPQAAPAHLDSLLEEAFQQELARRPEPAPAAFPWPQLIALCGFLLGLLWVPGFWELAAQLGRWLQEGLHWVEGLRPLPSSFLLTAALPLATLLGALGLSALQDQQ